MEPEQIQPVIEACLPNSRGIVIREWRVVQTRTSIWTRTPAEVAR